MPAKENPILIMSDIVHFMKYAKYLPDMMRRETFEETVYRNMEMHIDKYPHLEDEIRGVYKDYVLTKKVLPSMRSMQFAGKPIKLNHARIYNCSYLHIDHPDAFSEIMFLLLGGTGVGYSVQKKHVRSLPKVMGTNGKKRRFLIGDSIEGWADAVKVLVESYFYHKYTPDFIYDDIRPKGARLVTSGGKAPGPEPLRACLVQVERILKSAVGRKLTPLEAHDICCHIANAVLAGGIRRAALISLFSFTDDEMKNCKSNFKIKEKGKMLSLGGNTTWKVVYEIPGSDGEEVTKNLTLKDGVDDYKISLMEGDAEELPWWIFEPQRGRANNSAAIVRYRISKKEFMGFWQNVEDNLTGEPGIYFTNNSDWGANPCVEIALRHMQMCNLTEINVDGVTNYAELEARARAAAFLGTLQAGYTNFHYLRPEWRETCEKDALIGVSMTGIASLDISQFDLTKLGQAVMLENQRVAPLAGVNPAARGTCIKPSGTAAKVLGTSSGSGAWHAMYHIRRIQIKKNEAIYKYLAAKVPQLMEDLVEDPENAACLLIPLKAPEGAILREDETAVDYLERIAHIQKTWIDAGHIHGDNKHNVSATVSVKEDEWNEVGEWMWENKELYTGLSVLPYDGGTYANAPLEECDREKYEELIGYLRSIDLTDIVEEEDETDLQGELACAAGHCDI